MNVGSRKLLGVGEAKHYIHREMAAGRWYSMSLANQVGNVGSEYERALRAKAKGDTKYFDGAAARLFELLDLTTDDPRWSERRLQKLRRLREVIWNELCNDVEDPQPLDLRRYFLQAGVWANNQRAQERNRQLAIENS